ncbi:SusC/RagA family TonB-linked outer membrane protein [uncultured Chryseobacterium sp.]|uniref:SusC/RagA family TonB-linked outer membrane protein n=1 Tax=uncultured Chryseobacterium sp. TaxID=259322 RepID=UPI0025E636BF|nr:SusC/RagA family TonB-linked outer membrane protein [uncultured Chryseobacterium sp.]
MKKTAISIAVLGFLCLSETAYASAPAHLQQSVYSAKVPLTKVFEKLGRTTNMHFFYSASDLGDILVDDRKLNYGSLQEALGYLKRNYSIDFMIRNNTVTVKKVAMASAEKKALTNPIAMKRDTISPKEKNIDEIVMVGYGKQNRKDISGSISSIDEKQMKGIASSNFGDIIAGKATGIQITQANASPGSSPSIRVRGIGTLTSGSDPLIVVDGFPLSEGSNINSIDPNAIAKIDILKDAASAAIYGSRGANGVILIETKQGRNGKMEVSLDSYYGIQTRSDDQFKFVDAYDMATYLKEARDNNYMSKGAGRSISDDNATRKSKGASLRELIPDYLKPYLEKQPGLTNTDWLNTVLKPAPISQTSLNVFGGTDKTKYAFTGTYFNQQGLVIGTDYEKYSSNINLNTQLNSRLKLGVSLSPSFSQGNTLDMSGGGFNYNLIQAATGMYPFFAPYDENGNLNISQQIRANTPTDGALVENPVATAEMTKRKYTLFRTFGTAYSEVDILKSLKYKFTVGGDYTNYEYNFFDPSTLGAYRTAAPDVTKASRKDYIKKNYLIENLFTFDKKIGSHSISAIAGQSYQQEESNGVVTEATGFPDNSITNIAGGTSFKNTVSQYKWTQISYFTRLNYTYDSRYNLMASYRKDGSSRFGIGGGKWGGFYALSAGWTISKEKFFPENSLIDPVKLRYSLGVTGNNQIPNFGALSLMSPNNYVFGGELAPGYRSSTAPNPNISWEKSKSSNFGIDFSLFRHLLNVSADYYILDRDGLLLDVPVPQQSGYSTSLQNIGRVRNNGLEIQLSTRSLALGDDFEYSGSLSLSSNKNKVLALANGQDQIVTGSNNYAVTKVGGSISEMYGYNIIGVYKSQDQINNTPHITGTLVGDYIMEDLNGDGKIDSNDKKSFGSGMPKYILGFNNHFRYGNFELDFTLYSELGKKIYNGNAVTFTESGEGFAMASQYYFDHRYNPDTNPDGIYAMPNMNFSNNRKEARTSNIFYANGDYMRLRSLKLAYNFPQSLVSALKIKAAQVYFMGNNLLTISSYRGQNLDATTENQLTQGYDFAYYPVARIYSFGMNLKF